MKPLKHRKAIIAVFVLAVLLLAVAVLVLKWTGSIEVSSFNRNSELDFELCGSFGGSGAHGYSVPENSGAFGCTIYEKPSDNMLSRNEIMVSAYPDTALGKSRVTAISVEWGDGVMLGVRLGDLSENAVKALKKHGCKIVNITSTSISAKKGKISLNFTVTDGKITRMSARVNNTNVMHIVY